VLFFKRKLLERNAARPPPIGAPRVPAGQRVYAIGDIHGRLDLLDAIIAAIEQDLVDRPASDVITVLVGDYVDRGRSSDRVLDRLTEGALPGHVIALRGNHEEFLLRFLSKPHSISEFWFKCGGLETLHAYGVDVCELKRTGHIDEAAQAFRRLFPQRHLAFLERLPLAVEVGDYFFCHAGVRPGIALADQAAHDLLWIREDFLDFTGSFGKVIVHGHTPVERPDVRNNRINIDTGAYLTHQLTCLVLEGDAQRFLQT
jgi:serine/threonine protein phosphatase 1